MESKMQMAKEWLKMGKNYERFGSSTDLDRIGVLWFVVWCGIAVALE